MKKLGRIRGVGHRISGSRASQGKTRIDGRSSGIAGWEYVHLAVDDYSRLTYAEVLADEKATTAAGFLPRAIAFFARYGIRVERGRLWHYNHRRRHSALSHQPPVSRTNLLGSYG